MQLLPFIRIMIRPNGPKGLDRIVGGDVDRINRPKERLSEPRS